MANEKSFWYDVRVSVAKELIISSTLALGGLVLGLLTVVWAAVKPARDWLWSNANISRGGIVLMVLLMLMAIAVIIALANAVGRERATAHPPAVKHEAVKVDSDAFEWTQLRGWAFSALLTRIGQRTDLDQLYELLKATDFELPLMGKAHLARDMEAAERASIVGIDRLGKTRSYYYLTPHGRDWLLDKMQANKRTSTSEQM